MTDDSNNWDFLNHGLSTGIRDEISCNLMQREWLAMELECRNACWFDYRFLHPFDATMVYIAELNVVYQDMYRTYRDYRAAEYVRVIRPLDMIHSWKAKRTKIVACWKGRVIADQLGMPYQLYIRDAYKERLKAWNQRFLPQPNCLYSREIVDKVAESWRDRQKARMHFSIDPRFLNDQYSHQKAQDDHHEWLLEQVQFRSNPQMALDDLVKKGLLPQQKVESRLAA